MTRSVPEWVGSSDDTAIPPRVRLRVWDRARGRCQICDRKLGPSDRWEVDHVVALINGGAHAEANMQIACSWCHPAKSAADVAEKAKTARVRKKHTGASGLKRGFATNRGGKWKKCMDGWPSGLRLRS